MMPPYKLKFRRLYFIFCKFYVADRAFEIELFLCLRTYNHNTNSAIVSITPLSGPSIANVFASLMLERQTPPATYMVQAICQAWNQSRVNA